MSVDNDQSVVAPYQVALDNACDCLLKGLLEPAATYFRKAQCLANSMEEVDHIVTKYTRVFDKYYQA